MRLRWTLIISTGAIAAMAAAVLGELVFDVRTPRVSLVELHAITSSVSILMADYYRAAEMMKKKYGPDAQTALQTQPPRLVTSVGGKVVEESRAPSQFSNASGLFIIGPRGGVESTFPFQIDPRGAPTSPSNGKPGVQYLKSRFGTEFPAKYLDFDDRDAATDTCVTVSPTELGWPGSWLRLQSGTFCVVFWKGASPGSMLVGVALANGDPWMRPFSRRICRWLTTVALGRVAATDGEPPPDYAACLLVDRPDRSGAAETLKTHVFEVRRDATLAYAN